MGDRIDKIQDALNRSRRERLNKAAKQGYGPLVDMGLVVAPGMHYPTGTRSRDSRSRDRDRDRGGGGRGDRERERDRRSSRKASETRPEKPQSEEEAADVDGFLAPKRPGAVQKKAAGPAKLEIQITAKTNIRAIAANSGARPKAAPMKGPDADELRARQLEEKVAQEFAQMQSQIKKLVKKDPEPGDASPEDRGMEEEKQKHRDEKRKREEWRRQWKEEKKRKGKDVEGGRRDKSESSSGNKKSDSEGERGDRDPNEDPKQRFMMWRALNNNGVTTARDVQRKYVGQVTDAALDARLREVTESSMGKPLMTEAEALAKLQRKVKAKV